MAPYRKILAQIEDDDLRSMASLEVSRALNMTGGVASWHAKRVVAQIKFQGEKAFREYFKKNHLTRGL